MRLVPRTMLVATLVAMFAAASQFTVAANAQAAQSQAAAGPASLTLHSDPGDYFGQGNDYSYSRPKDQVWMNLGYNQSVIYATVDGLNGDHWTVQLDAPDSQPLQVGDYPDAQGAPFQPAGSPGIQVNQGFTCQTITGEFDVLDIEYAANGTLSRFDATFEEHCNGATAALTGEIIYTPPPVLPALSLNVKVHHIAGLDTTDGYVTVSGTVTCNQYDWTAVSVQLSQDSGLNSAIGNVNVSCGPGRVADWSTDAYINGPFSPGLTDTYSYASAQDGYTGTIATSPTATPVIWLIPIPGSS
jgi:hypothetical protein